MIFFIFLMIRLMHVICTGSDCVAKDNVPLTVKVSYLFIGAIYLCTSITTVNA